MEDSYIHIVKRTDQWKERAAQSYVVPRGVLCVELTSDGKTKIKVGEGNKYYSQLPYIGNDIDISQYFTKEEVKKLVQDTSEETVIAYMDKQPYVRVLGPILPSTASLPKSGNKDGDIRFVQLAKVTADGKAYIEYVWFNNRWDPLSTALDIDVSKFATKEELAAVQKSVTDLAKRVTLVEQVKHTHPNKGILDAITASFTIEQASKLAGIEPNANKYVLPIASRRSLGGIIIGEGLLIDASGKVTVDTSGIIVPPYDDTEVKRRLSNLETVAHTHTNKAILDATTASYTSVEKTKLAGLENYDDTALSGRVTTLEESSHTHTNKSVLDNTTASYTTEEQTKLAGLENYTLPIASNNTLGGIKVGANLSIDQDGVLSATGGGESKEYLAGEGISITERSEERDTPVDISSENWVNESPTDGGSRYTISTDRTYLLQRYSLAAGTSFKVKFVPTNPTDVIYYGFDSYPTNSDGSGGITVIGQNGFEVDQSKTYTMPADRNSLDIIIRINDTIWSSSDVVSAASFTELKLIITESISHGTFIDANVRDGLTIDSSDNTINVTPATDSTIGGIIVGNNLSIDANGVLSATGGAGYTAGDGINIRTETIGSEYDTSSEYYSIDETDLCYIGSSFTLTSERAALPKYAFVASHYNNNWNGPVLFSKNPEAVKYNTRGYTSNPVAFTYNNETWYRSDNGYWYQNSSISTNIKVDDLTGVVYDESDLVDYICSLLDTMHTESHTETIIENTGVLDVTKDNNGDLVVSTINGDTTLPLDHYALPIASANALGGVKVGDGLSIDQDGILSADGSIVYRAGAGISIETASGGDPSIYDTTHPYYSDTQTSAILDCPGRRRTYTRTTTNPAYVVISRVKNTGGSPYYWYTVYVISKNINDTLCNFLDSDHFSGRSSTADAVSVTIDGTTWYGNGYMISLGDINPVGDVNEVVPYFESEETSATDTVAAILDYIYSDDTSKYIVNTGVLDVTKNASGNLVVSKESGDTTITLPQEYTLPIASANDLGGVIIGDGISVDENGVISVTGGGGGGEGYSETELISAPIVGSVSSITLLDSMQNYDALTFEFGITADNLDQQFVRIVPVSDLNGTDNTIFLDGLLYASGRYWGVAYSVHKTSDTALNVSYMGTLTWSETGTIFSIKGIKYGDGGGGGSKEYLAGEGISIVTGGQIVTDLSSANWGNYADMYDGQRSPTSDSRTFKLRYLHIEPGTHFKIKLTPADPNDTIYWYLYGYENDAATTGGLHFGQSSDPNDWDTDGDYTYTMPAGKSSLDITVRINNPGYQQGDEVTLSKFDEMQYITGSGPSTKSINVTPATSRDIGGVIIGSGINVDQNGVISVNSSTEYVAGDGITINQGSAESTDITNLQWEQGSINPVNGEPDDLTTTVIRSPMIEVGLTNMLNVSAQDTSDNDMRWEASFYDSNSEFITMETTWQTLSDEVVRPDNAKYVVILLRKESETEIDENALKACEISWPIEIGKYVVTNTGVTHVGLTDDGSVIYVENGSTNTLLTFGQDLDVTNGVVTIPDYHRLVLNVEE